MEQPITTDLKWYHYVAAFFSGAFLTNTVPHLTQGICGNAFPTPFSDPPVKGLSSPLTNVLWALVNLIIGYLLLRASRMRSRTTSALIVFFLGVAAVSITLSLVFVDRER